MHTSIFFKLFPPPKFLSISHAGLDISDDAIRFIQYDRHGGSLAISKYGHVDLPPGLVDGGEIKDEKKFIDILSSLVRDNALSYAKISIPEEKAYLFETEVPSADNRSISQSIEFKLEENIPLSAADAVFAFDLLTREAGKPMRASVSAVPKSYIERMIRLLRDAGIMPISFETVPRAIARIISEGAPGASMVIHCMARKTGVDVVSLRAVGFTSTINDGETESEISVYVDALAAEVRRVYAYWLSRGDIVGASIKRVIVAGADGERVAGLLRQKVVDLVEVETADIWRAVFDTSSYVPPIERKDSPEYISAAGLAL